MAPRDGVGGLALDLDVETLAQPLANASASPRSADGRKGTHSPLVRHWPLVDPNKSEFLGAWDLLMAVCLLTLAVFSPFEIAYLDLRFDAVFLFDALIDMCFLMDMVLQFFIMYPDVERPPAMVKNPRAIAKNYVFGWFALDFVSVLPIDAYCLLTGRGGGPTADIGDVWHITSFRIIRLLRLVRLLRLARFARIWERRSANFSFHSSNLAVVKSCVIILALCHWTACFWGGLAVHRCGYLLDGEKYGSTCVSWLVALKRAKAEAQKDDYASPSEVYFLSAYWAVISLTSVGYGDITPQTTPEYWASMLCTLTIASTWAYMVGLCCCEIANTMNPHEVAYTRTMDDLNNLLTQHAVPQDLCVTTRRYIMQNRHVSQHRVEAAVVKHLSPKLRGEVAHFMYRQWLVTVWYLRRLSSDALVFVAERLVPALYVPGEDILEERTLRIIRRGICAISGRVFVAGQYWGEDMLLSNDVLRAAKKARAVTFLSLLSLRFCDLCAVMAMFPAEGARIRWAHAMLAMQRGMLKILHAARELQRNDPERRLEVVSADALLEFVSNVLSGTSDARDDGGGLGLNAYARRSQIDRLVSSDVPKRSSVSALTSDVPKKSSVSGDQLTLLTSLMLAVKALNAKLDDLEEPKAMRPERSTPRGRSLRTRKLHEFELVNSGLGSFVPYAQAARADYMANQGSRCSSSPQA